MRLAGSPATVLTPTPWRASSSASSPKVSRAVRERVDGGAQQVASRALGCLGAEEAARSAMPVTMPSMGVPDTRLSESTTGSTGMAAPLAAAAWATASTSAGVTNGRAPSCTSTTSAVAARTPTATVSCRRAPPASTRASRARSQSGAASAATRDGSTTTMTDPTERAAATLSTAQRSSDRSPSIASSLSVPAMRLLEPAATMTASAKAPDVADMSLWCLAAAGSVARPRRTGLAERTCG